MINIVYKNGNKVNEQKTQIGRIFDAKFNKNNDAELDR